MALKAPERTRTLAAARSDSAAAGDPSPATAAAVRWSTATLVQGRRLNPLKAPFESELFTFQFQALKPHVVKRGFDPHRSNS